MTARDGQTDNLEGSQVDLIAQEWNWNCINTTIEELLPVDSTRVCPNFIERIPISFSEVLRFPEYHSYPRPCLWKLEIGLYSNAPKSTAT